MISKRKTFIHPSAVVSPEALFAEGVEIGPFCVIGPKVKIGKDTRLVSHVHVEGDTEIGAGCEIFPGAILGTRGQVRQSEKGSSRLILGNHNVVREYVTIHASMKEGSCTVLGDRNLLMANAHVAHDCILGNDITMANLATLGGHVAVGDHVVIGGMAGVHQFVQIGRLAMLGAFSKAVMDIPPFAMVDGRPARFCGMNAVGLKRAGFDSARRLAIKTTLKILFAQKGNLSLAIAGVEKNYKNNADIVEILAFVKKSKRGLSRSLIPSEPDEE